MLEAGLLLSCLSRTEEEGILQEAKNSESCDCEAEFHHFKPENDSLRQMANGLADISVHGLRFHVDRENGNLVT